ncbi:MAG: hypothetical protein U0987_18750 [Afipia sp.]|nr:hypothetical protein [Afipia sp.]
MTRQQMFDWMNNQIRSGAMSLDDSTSFLGMVLKIDAVTGQPVDMTSDSTLVNFVDRATQGIAGRCHVAIRTMRRGCILRWSQCSVIRAR